jgi:hypothetical protein
MCKFPCGHKLSLIQINAPSFLFHLVTSTHILGLHSFITSSRKSSLIVPPAWHLLYSLAYSVLHSLIHLPPAQHRWHHFSVFLTDLGSSRQGQGLCMKTTHLGRMHVSNSEYHLDTGWPEIFRSNGSKGFSPSIHTLSPPLEADCSPERTSLPLCSRHTHTDTCLCHLSAQNASYHSTRSTFYFSPVAHSACDGVMARITF